MNYLRHSPLFNLRRIAAELDRALKVMRGEQS